jgi:hypothetical protein
MNKRRDSFGHEIPAEHEGGAAVPARTAFSTVAFWRRFIIWPAALVAVVLLATGCAHTMHRPGGVPGVDTTGIDISGYDRKPPVAPDRPADLEPGEGAKVWKNGEGRVSHIQLASGGVLQFAYDSYGRIRLMKEPTGAILARKGNGRHWVLFHPNSEMTTFEGLVLIQSDYTVRVLAQDGAQRVFNPNGYIVELSVVNGNAAIREMTNPAGRVAQFSYDASGRLEVIRGFDGVVLLRKEDGWYRWSPGWSPFKVSYTVVYDQSDGSVVVRTPSAVITYSEEGVSEEKIEPQP